jgi:hypothetical protein
MDERFRPGTPQRGWHNLPHDVSERRPPAEGQPYLPGLEPHSAQALLGEITVEATVNGFQPVEKQLNKLLAVSGFSWASRTAEKYEE